MNHFVTAMKALQELNNALDQKGTRKDREKAFAVVNYDGTDCATVQELAAANQKSDLIAALYALQHKSGVPTPVYRSAVRYLKELKPGPESNGDGVCIVFAIDDNTRQQLAIAGGEPWHDLHITLGYFGNPSNTITLESMWEVTKGLAESIAPFRVELSGLARFSAPEQDACVVLVDALALPNIYVDMRTRADEYQVNYQPTHGYTPHMTLGYLDAEEPMPLQRWTPITVPIYYMDLWYGHQRFPFRLGEPMPDLPNPGVKDVHGGNGGRPTRTRHKEIVERAKRLGM